MSDGFPQEGIDIGGPFTFSITPPPPKHADLKVELEHGADWRNAKGQDRIWSFFPRLALLAREDPRLSALMNEYVIEIKQKGRVELGEPDMVFWPVGGP